MKQEIPQKEGENHTIKKQWFLIPRLIIDDKKYRGRGRPRKTDYRMYPDKERDFCDTTGLIWSVEDTKNWVYSEGNA